MRRFRLCLSLLLLAASADAAEELRIRISHVNDVYQIRSADAGGLPRLATFLAEQARDPSPRLVTFGGDTLSPSVTSTEFKGAQMIAAWNALGVDFAVPGNHEFDHGPAVLEQRIRESGFPWLAANIAGRDGLPFPGTRAYAVKEIGGVRIGFFGVIVSDIARMSQPGPDTRFADPVATACRLAKRLRREERVAAIVALTHLDLATDRKLARQCRVDLILGGHDHHVVSEVVGGVPIFKAGADARGVVEAALHIDRARGRLDRIEWRLVPLDRSIAEDPRLVSLAGKYEDAVQEKLAERIGETATALDARTATVRLRESAAGYWVADAFRDALAADAALVNGGALRSDAVLGPGPLTKLDVKRLLPFENHVLKLEVTGEQLREVFEGIAENLGTVPLGRFPHVSGMTAVFDPGLPAGQRLLELRIGGRPVDAARTYTLAVSEYLAAGKDGYRGLKDARRLLSDDQAPIETEVAIVYLARRRVLDYRDEGRIRIR